MAEKHYISKINLGNGDPYLIKDLEAQQAVTNLQSQLATSLVFSGVVSTADEVLALTDYKAGYTYKVGASFNIPGIGIVENGDMIICVNDFNTAFAASDWAVVQNNVDTFIGATASTNGTRGLVPAPTSVEQDAFLNADGSWKKIVVPPFSWKAFDAPDEEEEIIVTGAQVISATQPEGQKEGDTWFEKIID